VSTPDSVRLALPVEAPQLAALQRRAWAADLPPDVSTVLQTAVSADEMTQVWHQAITRPPLAAYRVLVAVTAQAPLRAASAGGDEAAEAAPQRVVGFAAIGPSDDEDASAGDAAVLEFVIDPAARRLGHGSRLMNAVVDTARADGFAQLAWWVASQDDMLRRFVLDAGWAPDGAHRTVGTPDGNAQVKQVRLVTDITV